MYQTCRSCGPRGDGLGFWEYVPHVIDVGRDLFSDPGDQNWRTRYQENGGVVCPGQPPKEEILRGVKIAPAAMISAMCTGLQAGNKGVGPANRAELLEPEYAQFWITAAMGGDDCKNKSQPHLVGLLDEFAALGRSGAGSGAPVQGAPDPYYGGGGQALPATPEEKSFRDRFMAWVEDRVPELVGWAYEELPPHVRRELEQEYLQRRARDVRTDVEDRATAAVPWLLGGGLALAVARQQGWF